MKESKHPKLWAFASGFLFAIICVVLVKQAAIWLPVSSFNTNPASERNNVKIKQTLHAIKDNFIFDYTDEELTEYMFLGLVSGLGDKYSTYFTREEYEEISMGHSGDYKGVGISIFNDDEGNLVIDSVTAGGPAENAGIMGGDQILKVNGEDFAKSDASAVTEFIKAIEGNTMTMQIFRPSTGETLDFEMEFAALEAFSVGYGMYDDEIGYIKISTFTARTPQQFKDALDALNEEGMKALIIDVRNNLGGLVSGVVGVLEDFMPEGVMVSSVYKDGTKNEEFCSGENELDIPIVLLVNSSSASASEILAGAVKDYGVGTIVGTKTYGKGIVQDVFGLIDGSVIRLTVAKYYTPNGNYIHGEGIEPDVYIENAAGKDLQFNKAVEVLEKELN